MWLLAREFSIPGWRLTDLLCTGVGRPLGGFGKVLEAEPARSRKLRDLVPTDSGAGEDARGRGRLLVREGILVG